MTVIIPICVGCKHFRATAKDRESCAAFPNRIPEAILGNDVDHRKPYRGDHGIQFEPVSSADAVFAAGVFEADDEGSAKPLDLGD